jgi:hypothetical protein
MAVFGKRRRKDIAPFILAFWLFSLFVSVAHACGLDDDLGHTARSEPAKVGGHNGLDDGASPACDKFCSDDLPLLAKLRAVQDSPTGQALTLAPFATNPFQVTVAPVPPLLSSSDPPPGIAVNIRFVRLAL